MSKQIKLRKGLDIRMKGKADNILIPEERPGKYGIKPVDFPGLVPKMSVRPGDKVKAGSPLFYNKHRPAVLFTSPVSGVVLDVVRGEKRKILEVVVEAEGDSYEDFGKANPESLDRDAVKEKILAAGLWPALRQRPYNIVANPEDNPKSIFVSGFDSAPLAADYDFIIDQLPAEDYATGLKVLQRLTDGRVHLGLSSDTVSETLRKSGGVEIHYFSGPHPAGNVGVQIHHIDPVNKGEAVWYMNLQDVVTLGRLFNKGEYRPERIIAVAGAEVKKPRYHRTRAGAEISTIIKDNIAGDNVRYISGNVLTGTAIKPVGFLGFYDSVLTVITEGNYYEFFGWIMPGLKKFSFSRTFLTWLMPDKKYSLDTNMHGGDRAFVVTGYYEQVLPMDIYPMHLLKAILAEDIDRMEQLGIYEVAAEDFALCEFICPSKVEVQSIIRKGLDMMITEMS
ncbi:MAG: Na(+)-translocating NADH-quinone reductase subunit A [Bacteroidales bacterium]